MLYNKRSYNPVEFENTFKQTKIYSALAQQYQHIIFDGTFSSDVMPQKLPPTNLLEIDDRKFWSTQELWSNRKTRRQVALEHSIVDAMPFYYLNFITETAPEKIYDIGCGCNFFAKYIPNIVGVSAELPDSEHFLGDEHGFVDDEYIHQHQQLFASAFSLSALHFIPITQLRRRVMDFMSMIKPNGVGYLALNTWRMLEHSKQLDLLGLHNYNDLDMYVRTQLDDMPFEYLAVDIDISQKSFALVGNIRLVMQNK
jgi:hypothetical protein